ncbi:MAG: transporter substrate-binding domain-containing protein [Rhodospirillaceae bacterium]|nr:MAG: transporter substrate-binding domain-containing protein [Rhodospirillaceae bacterium]
MIFRSIRTGQIAAIGLAALLLTACDNKSNEQQQAQQQAQPSQQQTTEQQAASTSTPAPAPADTQQATATPEVIKFGFAQEPYPPFASQDSAGKWVGFEVDLMNAVCEAIKAKCELVPIAWDGIIPALNEKKIDVIWASMSITPERKQVIDFTNKYYNSPAEIIGPKSDGVKIGIIDDPDGKGGKIANPADAKGKIIGVQTSTIHANYIQKYFGKDAEVKVYDTQDNANTDLVAGRVDLVMADSVALSDFLKSDQGKKMEVKVIIPENPLLGEGVGGGLRKGDDALKAKLNDGIKAVRDSGKYNEIAKKYFDFDIFGS